MTKDIANYIASCDICARVNPASPKTLAPLQPIKPVAKVFGDRLHLDLVDMPRSAAGNVAICTIIDAATGFVIVVACPDKTHAGVINALCCHVFPNYGCPRLLVSDKGKEKKMLTPKLQNSCLATTLNTVSLAPVIPSQTG